MATTKRTREDEEGFETPGKRRKTSTSSAGLSQAAEISEEDRLLLRLKDEENLPWKEIAARFQTDMGKSFQVPALQMRLKRLRERLRVWTDMDVKALRMAHEYYMENKFEIIAAKMAEFGASDKWTSKQCARKWVEIEPSATPFITTQDDNTPSYSFTASPVEAPSYLPYHLHMPQ
ncbi:uncharacterized protein K452DRAFT_328827 [Aplosporella prunicola CBS 121167]|uniref:Myb-like domain-containing protein n=1 Tax=Aplosporella prunicola CBS 121167 TaxID=1176127 RepID=A0A6A6B258_9PEZI|nr:uncharacterized protein K452DRAFT_328827 [Aplosporella prunicola CBS 121167]KAF2138269.1 hypothetical protein K452DRAFT_328827 [Aplosporella prunicola CBS 121167]